MPDRRSVLRATVVLAAPALPAPAVSRRVDTERTLRFVPACI